MYTKEMLIKAVQLYIKYQLSGASVRHELEYPDNRTIKKWYDEYLSCPETCFSVKVRKPRKNSLEQRQAAVTHYLEHGKCYARTVRALGYPNRNVLRQWVGALAKERKKLKVSTKEFSYSKKTEAVIELSFRKHSAKQIAEEHDTSHTSLYKVYLSPLADCFDGLLISWRISTKPDAILVNSMLDAGISTLKEDERPIVHSDRGCHYRWSGWIDKMKEAKLIRSMSKKGCTPDNAACVGLFGRKKK